MWGEIKNKEDLFICYVLILYHYKKYTGVLAHVVVKVLLYMIFRDFLVFSHTKTYGRNRSMFCTNRIYTFSILSIFGSLRGADLEGGGV